jgi:hypothetical protein
METNRVSQPDETGSGYIFLNNMPLLPSRHPPIQKKGKGLGMSGFWLIETNIEKLNVHIRIGLYGENQSSSK